MAGDHKTSATNDSWTKGRHFWRRKRQGSGLGSDQVTEWKVMENTKVHPGNEGNKGAGQMTDRCERKRRPEWTGVRASLHHTLRGPGEWCVVATG